MSIFKGSFNKEIQTQIEKRQDAILYRTPENLSYMNSRNAWIRLSSSVNVYSKDVSKATEAELLDDGNYDNSLAKKYVLQGGILNNGNLRAGLGDFSNAYSNISSDGTTPYRLGIRPMPGITNIDVKSKGAYGSLREATVNFQCWDIKQLEDLELLYMRPGYSVLLEWGWAPFIHNTKGYQSTFTDYTDIVNKKYTKEELFSTQYAKSADGKINNKTQIEGYHGNYDAMYGIIKNYGWSARPDGGYDCHANIVSMGEIMESLKVNYSPLDNQTEILSKGLISENIKTSAAALGITIDTSIMKTLSDSYCQNILAGMFDEMWEIGQQLGKQTVLGITTADEVGHHFVLTDSKYGSTYNMFRITINVVGGSSAGSGTGTIGKTDEQIYITLESLVNLLNNYVLLKDPQSGKPMSPLSVRESDITNIGVTPNNISGDGYLLSLAHPLQISVDPTVCILKNLLWAAGFGVTVVAPAATINPANPTAPAVVRYGTQPNNDYDNAWWTQLISLIIAADNSSSNDQALIDFVQRSVKNGPGAIEELKEIQRRYIEIKATPTQSPGNITVVGKTLSQYSHFYDLLDEGLNALLGDVDVAIGSIVNGGRTADSQLIMAAATQDPSTTTNTQVANQNAALQAAQATGAKGFKYLNNKDMVPYFIDDKYDNELGIIGNIYVNLNMLYLLSVSTEVASKDTKEKNDVALYDFMKNVLSRISTATGNVNNFEVYIDPIDSVSRIIDVNYVDKDPASAYNTAFPIELQNTKSIVRSYKLESQIFPDQVATVAIGSQVKGGALGSDNNTLVAFNKGIIDRVVPRKEAPTSPPNNTSQADKLSVLVKALSTIYSFFANLDAESFSTGIFQDGYFDTSEVGKYQNALKDLINYFKELGASKIKNKAIIPTKLSLVMDGIGGIVIGNIFRIPDEILPKGYKPNNGGVGAKIGYAVTGLGHSIQNNDWVTNVDAQFIIMDEPEGIVINFSNLVVTSTPGKNPTVKIQINGKPAATKTPKVTATKGDGWAITANDKAFAQKYNITVWPAIILPNGKQAIDNIQLTGGKVDRYWLKPNPAFPASLANVVVPLSGNQSVTVNVQKEFADKLNRVFIKVKAAGLQRCLKSCAGAFAVRNVTNGYSLSFHAWGFAIDFNSNLPGWQYGDSQDPATQTYKVSGGPAIAWTQDHKDFYEIMKLAKAEGIGWLNKKDPMHISLHE
jgi:hypothetical protein